MSEAMNQAEQEAAFIICLMAAFADGDKSEVERAEVKRIAEAFPDVDRSVFQKVLLRQVPLKAAAQPLSEPGKRHLAYEMAVCVCEADGALNDREKDFLSELRQVLAPEEGALRAFHQEADQLAPVGAQGLPPVITETTAPAADSELDKMILNYAILNGALELLPESISTMAIIPLQMKMVYRVGKTYGYELDRGHIAELLGAAGLGITSQVVEGFAQKLLRGFFGKVTGGLGRGIGGQIASSAISFASTYGLGHLARQYYGSSRKLSSIQLRELYGRLSAEARDLHSRYAPEIQERARNLDPAQILNLVRRT
jgi:uncharacterized protein (DUF697 family)